MGSAMQRAREIDPREVSAEEALGYKKPAHRAAEGLTFGQRVRQTFGGSGKPVVPAPEEKKKRKSPPVYGGKEGRKYLTGEPIE